MTTTTTAATTVVASVPESAERSEPSLLSAALWYAARGWRVFPLVPGSKRPAVEAWETAATTDPDRIRAGWGGWGDPDSNIGIACGPSGLVVIDLDLPKEPGDTPPAPWDAEPGIRDGADVLATLADRAGQPFPFGTYQVQTVSGGTHLYFTQPPGLQLRNTTGRLGWKIDTRGHGGYIVAAGSIVDGRRYTTLHAIRPAVLPQWLADALTRRPEPRTTPTMASPSDGTVRADEAYAHAALRGELERVLAATKGHRNHTLNEAAYNLGQLIGAGLLDGPQVTAALHVAAEHIGLYPAEAIRTIASGLNSGTTQPRQPRLPRQTA